MTRITNSDQILMLLRAHLQKAERTQRSRSATKPGRSDVARQSPVERAQEIAQSASLSDEDIERALVSGLLTEEFGSPVALDPQFQTVVDEVLKLIRSDLDSGQLLQKAREQLMAGRA